MAEKTFVYVPKFDVLKTFDDGKYKSRLKSDLQKMTARWVEKLGMRAKGDKKEKGFMLGGSLEKLLMGEKNGQVIMAAEMRLYMTTNPKGSMFGFPSGKAKFEGVDEARLDKEVSQLLNGILEPLVKKAVKEFGNRAKKKK